MKGHEEDMCPFKLKAMKRVSTKLNKRPDSSEAFAVEQTEMSEFSDASDDIKEMPEMQELLDNMETDVCNHYIILNKSET
jgi:hypothetical protein